MHAEEILEKAHERTGILPGESGSYREGLEALIFHVQRKSSITPFVGQNLIEGMIANLSARLRVEHYLDSNPQISQQLVRKPVIVFGLPRTGTTLLSHLLAADPARRSLLNWEADDPIPPAKTEALSTDPRCLRKRLIQEFVLAFDPTAARAHWEFADEPTECDAILRHDFKSAHWAVLVPEYGAWLRRCDMSSAYRYHKTVLQVLQSAAPGQWNLKSTCHGLFLDSLRKTYPDARLIWIHRDPFKALASTCSLIRAQQVAIGAEIDLKAIAYFSQSHLAEILDRSLDAAASFPCGTIYHFNYAELMEDPIAQMRKLYGWLGDAFTPELEAGMREWLRTHPPGRYGKHQYSPDEFGLSESAAPEVFLQYIDHFGIKREN
jgi:Sulfotransferase family